MAALFCFTGHSQHSGPSRRHSAPGKLQLRVQTSDRHGLGTKCNKSQKAGSVIQKDRETHQRVDTLSQEGLTREKLKQYHGQPSDN